MRKHFFILLLVCCSISVRTFAQSENQEPFSFDKQFHALGFSMFNGINFAPKLQDPQGTIKPILYHAYVPEFTLQYNMMIKNGFGFALEVPFGTFKRNSLVKLSDYGESKDVPLEIGSLYIGFIGKLTVLKELSSKVCMQGELGLKFNPFYHSADRWYTRDYYAIQHGQKPSSHYDNGDPPINFITIEQKYYAVPDATGGLLFFFHSQKNPRSNLVLGLNVNLSFVERIKVIYDTAYSDLEYTNHSTGSYGWNSTAIGITVGYRFFGVK